MSDWISVDDSLPKELEPVIAAKGYEHSDPDFCAAWHKGGRWHLEMSGLEIDGNADVDMDFKPTHWMQLPDPPKM